MKTFTIAVATAVLAALGASAAGTPTSMGVQQASQSPVTMDPRVQGCWGSSGDLVLVNKTTDFNSRDKCGKEICQGLKKNVAATYRASECWCGDKYPPLSKVVADSNCNLPCPGFGQDACGGPHAWTVYNTGLELYGVEFSEDTSSSSSTAAGSTPTSGNSNSGGSAPAATQTGNSNSGGSSNVAGIAAGVVVGVIAIGAIAGGIWFYMRRKRNQEIEEEHRRNAAVNAFINNNQKPGSSSGMSMTDSRMDPSLAERRMSDGSIADNQDYSRRILRVTNA